MHARITLSNSERRKSTVKKHYCVTCEAGDFIGENRFLTVILKSLTRRLWNERTNIFVETSQLVQCSVGGEKNEISHDLKSHQITAGIPARNSQLITKTRKNQNKVLCLGSRRSSQPGKGKAENGSCLRNKNLKQNNKRTNKTKKEQKHEQQINTNTLHIGKSKIKKVRIGAFNT